MTELSGTVFEPLWGDGEFILSRGVRDGDRSPLLVETPALEQPAPGSLQRRSQRSKTHWSYLTKQDWFRLPTPRSLHPTV